MALRFIYTKYDTLFTENIKTNNAKYSKKGSGRSYKKLSSKIYTVQIGNITTPEHEIKFELHGNK